MQSVVNQYGEVRETKKLRERESQQGSVTVPAVGDTPAFSTSMWKCPASRKTTSKIVLTATSQAHTGTPWPQVGLSHNDYLSRYPAHRWRSGWLKSGIVTFCPSDTENIGRDCFLNRYSRCLYLLSVNSTYGKERISLCT